MFAFLHKLLPQRGGLHLLQKFIFICTWYIFFRRRDRFFFASQGKKSHAWSQRLNKDRVAKSSTERCMLVKVQAKRERRTTIVHCFIYYILEPWKFMSRERCFNGLGPCQFAMFLIFICHFLPSILSCSCQCHFLLLYNNNKTNSRIYSFMQLYHLALVALLKFENFLIRPNE